MSRFNVGDYADDDFDPIDDKRTHRRRRPRRREWDITPEDPDLPEGATRSTYQESRASQGPQPPPVWLITTAAAVDHERGILRTGKEADIHLVERVDPATGSTCLLAAKRYRSHEHRMFHRDAGYLEGRRVRRSRENRAMGKRTAFGRDVIAGQWASAEFDVLGHLWSAGIAVPYPAQFGGTSLVMEFIGDADGTAAPRLADLRPSGRDLADLWQQCCHALLGLAEIGYTHGDLSAYNLLVHHGRLVIIDLPQVVDVVVNPQGPEFLRRDCLNICRWFTTRGSDAADAAGLFEELSTAAGL